MHCLPSVGRATYAAVMHGLVANLEDGALARRIGGVTPATDAAAEAELCRRFAPRIRLYGLRHLRDDAASADLVQDVLLLVLNKLRANAVREPDRIASFIFGTCRQVVADSRRTGHRRERLLDTFADSLPAAVEEDDDEGLDARQLAECLGRLPARERTVLVMSFYDDRAAAEVADALGTTAGNVRVIRHRGIERLRTCLGATEAT